MDTSVHWARSHGQGNKAKGTRGAAGERGGDHVSARRAVDFVEGRVGVEFSILLDLQSMGTRCKTVILEFFFWQILKLPSTSDFPKSKKH